MPHHLGMRFSQTARLAAVLAVASVALLSGCATQPAPPTEAGPTADPTPAAEEAAAIATLTIGGTAITALDAEGAVLGSVDYTSAGAAAVEFLSDAFGSDPVVAARPGDSSCLADATQATWGDGAFVLVYDFPELSGQPDGQAVQAVAKAATVGDVAVTTPEGFAVGQPIAALVTAIPNVGVHTSADDAFGMQVDYAVVAGTYEDMTDPDFGMSDNAYWGAQAHGEGGVIATLTAPTYFQSAC